MSSESVKVCDREIDKLADLAECWDEIETTLGKYVSIMKKVHTETIKSGHIHEAVDLLCFYAKDIRTYAKGLGAKVAKESKKLPSKAEAVDLNLYNEV